MQGPVYGISTDETDLNSDLMPHFNYDEIFGTVINRFIVQAVAGYDLTIYGGGGQTRGYLNLRDTLQCVYLASMEPAKHGELRIFNQVTETFSVNEIAERVKIVGDGRGHKVRLNNIENPRVEKEDHYYNPQYTGLLKLGLEPHFLSDDVLNEMFEIVEKYRDNINTDSIFRGIKWK
jgi:UDP-sulfoquinovose synthase